MGFSSLAIIDSCIQRVYAIRAEINGLYQQKHQLADFGKYISTIQMTGASLQPGEVAPVHMLDFRSGMPRFSEMPMQNGMQPGTRTLNKEQAEALYEGYLRQINAIESEITQKLEHLKAEMQALEKEQEQFQKYTSQDIDKVYGNPYQGRG